MDYRATLNLPQTDFPMKADLPRREPEIQRFWEELDIYRAAQERTAGRPKYILHDGPPYTSGDLHLGQALNKILKDIVVKFKTMQGFDAPFIPGWDMHGLPTEMRAIKTFDIDRHAIDPLELRAKSAETALHFMEVQRRQFKRLGVRGDWEHPYLTVQPAYEGAVLGVFRALVAAGCVYRGLKPVYWCATCETALAEAEIEYKDHTSASIYVKFPFVGDPGAYFPELKGKRSVSFLIWTTTPWTLPANVALAVHPEFEYVPVRCPSGTLQGPLGVLKGGEEIMVLAKAMVETALREAGCRGYEVIGKPVHGRDLEGARTRHPFVERESPVVLADYVTLEQGTGVVHTAPGHGKEDFQTGRIYHLPVIQPLDARGVFTDEGGKFAGMRHTAADAAILQELRDRGALVAAGQLTHSYPHCWRCGEPIIFRATEQWFVAVDQFTPQALAAIEGVTWIPPATKERIRSMVAERPDWCISRQRVWGIPIPAFYCLSCGRVLLTPEVVDSVRAIVEREGSDAWFKRPAADFLPPGTACPECGGAEFRKETDIFDVWFDSGSSHAAVLLTRPELAWPADLYMEGHDQHRGWFQASLWTSIVSRGAAPYRAVLTTGFFLDETGRKMSKSLGNIIDPQEIAGHYGADILRLWVSYVDFKADMPMSEDIFGQVIEAYRRIRNTARFLLANLYDFDPAAHAVEPAQMFEVDRWALHRLQQVVERVTAAYETFEFHRVYHTLNTFCAVDLSAFYLDMLKDRLYTSPAASRGRRSAQTALHGIVRALARLLAPILTHTAEEIWQAIPGAREPSVQLADWPQVEARWLDAALGERWVKILALRDEIALALEGARQAKLINQPLEASVTIYAPPEQQEVLAGLGDQLASVLIVSQACLADGAPPEAWRSEAVSGLAVVVERARGGKCQRCWQYQASVGKDSEHPGLCARCRRALGEI